MNQNQLNDATAPRSVDQQQACSASGPIGEAGCYGPNDDGFLCLGIRAAAKQLVSCSVLWSEGHYPHSNAKVMPESHPIAIALAALATLDSEISVYANEPHSPKLFAPYMPSKEAQTRWDHERLKGADGVPNEKALPRGGENQ